jgi:hypothetical protein
MGALVHWSVKVFILIGCLFWGWNKYLTNVTAAHGSWHFLAPHSFVTSVSLRGKDMPTSRFTRLPGGHQSLVDHVSRNLNSSANIR